MTIATTPEDDEWYTPDWILDIVYSCFDVDVDPCSPTHFQNVKAAIHFTRETNGLNREWNGNVFMNCPYGRELPVWINKLLKEVGGGQD